MQIFARRLVFLSSIVIFASVALTAQAVKQPCRPVDSGAVGDAPADPGPLATNLSTQLDPVSIQTVMKKVADWQLKVAEPAFNQQWTFAALYDGLFAASATTGDARYRDAVTRFATAQQWKLVNCRFPHADDMAIGKFYLDLYLSDPPAARKPEFIANTRAVLDDLIVRPDNGKQDLWWWCDALYMAPPVLARMSVATGDPKYLAYMDRQWGVTTWHLYDPQYHLFYRDDRFLTQHESNGKPIFWARGNGWVMGALVKVLQVMPANDPHRPKYVAMLKDIAAEAASIQGPDGLWRPGLLDPDHYPLPEVSGSAFITYGIAYGINEHILDDKTYRPVVDRAWKGMLSHIYADGRLGSIQPIGFAPDKFTASASYVYGVGGFLLAGSELDRMARLK